MAGGHYNRLIEPISGRAWPLLPVGAAAATSCGPQSDRRLLDPILRTGRRDHVVLVHHEGDSQGRGHARRTGGTTRLAPVRIGVVGLGLIAQVVHLQNLARLAPLFQVTHVSDLSATLMASAAARLPGTPRMSSDAQELFADPDLDAVLLLTPGAHGPLAAAALQAGKHVISEKPLCVTQREARELHAQASALGRVLAVAYMKAYDPAVAAARSALAQIGSVQLISVEVRHPTDANQVAHLDVVHASDIDRTLVNAAEEQEGELVREALGEAPDGIASAYRDVLLGSAVHELAAIRALGFAPPRQYEHVAAWPFDPSGAMGETPSIAATATLEGGALFRLQWLWLPDYPRYEETITIVGTRGAVHLDMPQPYGPNVAARLRTFTQQAGWTEVEDGRHRRQSGFIEELRAFHAAIEAGRPVPTDAEAAADDTASLQALAARLAAGYGLRLGGEVAG